jgi:hypothetical protein
MNPQRIRRKPQKAPLSQPLLEDQTASPGSISTPQANILQLQATIGNRAVQRMLAQGQIRSDGTLSGKIQRGLSAEERAQNLTSSRFAGNQRLEDAYDNNPAMSSGSGEAVKIIQQALLDLGYAMPVSTSSTGEPDGIYGSETRKIVKQFQIDQQLPDKDGVVGRQTLGRLDELFGAPPPESKPEIENTEEATGQHIVDEVNRANTGRGVNAGIWYAHNYKAEYKTNKDAHEWKVPWNDDLENGYADPRYWIRTDFMQWKLKPGVSASEGIKAWLEGLTIAECLTAIMAIETDTMRAALGDVRFDELFGSKNRPPQEGLLEVGMGPSTVRKYLTDTEGSQASDMGTMGNRPVELGEWYYFYNHPRYLLKHPFGAFQGENAVYMGKNPAQEQLWAGLGVPPVTEKGMLEEMAAAYNGERDPDDYREILQMHNIKIPKGTPESDYEKIYLANLDKIQDKYRHDRGEYPDNVTPKDILDAPEYELDGRTRKGGFKGTAGQELDLEKIESKK